MGLLPINFMAKVPSLVKNLVCNLDHGDNDGMSRSLSSSRFSGESCNILEALMPMDDNDLENQHEKIFVLFLIL